MRGEREGACGRFDRSGSRTLTFPGDVTGAKKMSRYLEEPGSGDRQRKGRLGILLVNLGTPDAPTPEALKRYLAEFLWDPRIVEMPRPLWWLILHGRILRTRPQRSAEAYRSVWTEKGSPLLETTKELGTLLQRLLSGRLAGPVEVVVAMRYGNPSIPAGMEALRNAGCRRIVVLPLYPQYSSTTTASAVDAITAHLGRLRHIPEMRFIMDYHDDAGYVQALANTISEHWARRGERPDRLLFSFHGIPEKTWRAGDPYPEQCHSTARLVAEKLGLEDGRWHVAFQSRFGRAKWVTPYTDQTLKEWGKEGVKRVDVVCPGFPVDCLETLEEIGQENRRYFLEAGGRNYDYIPALNLRADHAEALAGLVTRHVKGWPEAEREP